MEVHGPQKTQAAVRWAAITHVVGSYHKSSGLTVPAARLGAGTRLALVRTSSHPSAPKWWRLGAWLCLFTHSRERAVSYCHTHLAPNLLFPRQEHERRVDLNPVFSRDGGLSALPDTLSLVC
jgi:hypothetical protein